MTRNSDVQDIDHLIQLLIRNLVEIKDTSGEFLLRLDDGRVIDTKGWNDWEWTHGIGLLGLWKFYEQTRDPRCRQIMLDWFANRFAAGTPTKNINTVAPFLTLAYLQEENPNAAWPPYLNEWAEWLMDGLPRTEERGFQHIVFNSVNEQQLWDDTLMMSVMPLAKIGLLLERPQYVEEARRQFLLHVKYLVDRKSGLWFHGWTFDGRHNFAEARWARGNAWITAGMLDLFDLGLSLRLRLTHETARLVEVNVQFENLFRAELQPGLHFRHVLLTPFVGRRTLLSRTHRTD